MKVLVCGSRSWHDVAAIHDRFARLPDGFSLIVGDARGADQIAKREAYATGRCSGVEWCRAEWETHGRQAGIVRNLHMLDLEPDLVIAFWDGESRGTSHTVTEAIKRGIPVETVMCSKRPSDEAPALVDGQEAML